MTTPKLRFKEFDGDWIKTTLLDLSENKSLNNGVFNDQNKVGKGYKLINVLDMYIERDIDEHCLSLLDLNPKEFERNKVKYGDIFFTRSSLVKEGIAFSNVYLGKSDDVTYDGHLIKLSPDLNRINSIFLNLALKTSKVRKQLIQGGKTATMTTIGQKEVGTTRIDIPLKDEQTKIASFLSAVDEKISQLTQKHELLSQYKQGMMQKLFSQQIRFKADDGSEFGEWEETEIKNISKIFDGTHQTPNYVAEGVSFYSVEHVTANNFTNTKYIAEDVYLAELKRVQVEKGDILLTRIGDIGTSKLIDWDVRASFYVSLALIKVNQRYNSSFVNQYIKSEFFQEELHQRTIHVAFPKKINLGEIGLCLIKIPCLEEQTQIANFLSAIDHKIEVVAQQIEQAKQWKKGLLQQMFV